MDKYSFLTADPHYIPGYTGYCPQLKFHAAKPYGKLTGELLTSPEVKHSSRLVLSTDTGADLTLRSIPDRNLSRTIPGYTGFIPNSRNIHACTFSETCRRALMESHQEKQARLLRQSSDLPIVVSYNSQQTNKPKLPLTPTCNKVIPYDPWKYYNPTKKTYSVDGVRTHKHFISGFMGHVPQARFSIGKSYPDTNSQALIQFGKKPSHVAFMEDPHRGVVPLFAGHIPGYQFMFGKSFGQLSKTALENNRQTKKTQRDKS